MPLYLLETTPTIPTLTADEVTQHLKGLATTAGAEFIEARITADGKHAFAIVQHDGPVDALTSPDDALAVDDVAEVRLVGAELDDVRAARDTSPQYLVEWDLPDDLDMDTYLARKREKSPRYADVPETTFRWTYVREDLGKCLCFYDASCADDVFRARAAVEAPVDRFHELA